MSDAPGNRSTRFGKDGADDMFPWMTVVLVVTAVVLVIGAIAFLINKLNSPGVN